MLRTAHVLRALLLMLVVDLATAQVDVSWHTIDGGGGLATIGASFELGGTIGQPDAGQSTGGVFTLTGGFWPVSTIQTCNACDANCDGSVNQFDIQPFIDALVTGLHPCGACAGDANDDGTINQFDIQAFVQCLLE